MGKDEWRISETSFAHAGSREMILVSPALYPSATGVANLTPLGLELLRAAPRTKYCLEVVLRFATHNSSAYYWRAVSRETKLGRVGKGGLEDSRVSGRNP